MQKYVRLALAALSIAAPIVGVSLRPRRPRRAKRDPSPAGSSFARNMLDRDSAIRVLGGEQVVCAAEQTVAPTAYLTPVSGTRDVGSASFGLSTKRLPRNGTAFQSTKASSRPGVAMQTKSAGVLDPGRYADIMSQSALIARAVANLASLVIIAGAALIAAGIQLMHVDAPFTLWPGMPTFTLGDEFGNAHWVALGTLLLLAGCIAVACGRRDPAVASGLDEGESVDLSAGRLVARSLSAGALRTGVLAAALSGAAYLYVLLRAPSHQAGAGVLVCLAGTALLATFSLRVLLPAAGPRRARAFPALGWLDGTIICLVALAFIVAMLYDVRYWFYAFWGDEWAFFDVARGIATGNAMDYLSQAGVYGIHPVANSAYTALIMRAFGLNVAGWRLSAILSVAAAVPPLYLLGLAVGGRATAIAAAVFYTGCHLLWAYSHIGYNNDDLLLVVVAAAALLYAGVRANRLYLLFASGACAGAAWYTIFTGRLMIAILVVVLLTEWGGGWRATALRIGALAGGFAVVVLPLVLDNGSNTVSQMFTQVSLSHDRAPGALSSLVQTNTIRGMYAFFFATENLHYVVGEVFDAVSAAALCVGVVVALRHVRDLSARLLLIWLGLGLLLTMPLFYANHVADTRLQIAVPPAALLAGWGLVTVARAMAGLVAERARGPVFALCLTAALVASVALNVDKFYRYMPEHVSPTDIAMTIGGIQKAAANTIILAGKTSNNNLCQVLQGFEIDPTRVLRFQGGALVEQCPSGAPALADLQPQPASTITILIAPEEVALARSCSPVPLPFLVSPDRSRTLWAITLPAVVGSPATSPELPAGRAAGACPALTVMPPS